MKRTLPSLVMLIPLLVFSGCGPKKTPKITERYQVNRDWVYRIMSEYYLWAHELPPFDQSEANTPTQEYFDRNLRYRYNKGYSDWRNDTYGDRFSRIEYTGSGDPATEGDTPTRSGTERQYDYGFMTVHLGNNVGGDFVVDYIQVLYVLPGSPAEGVLRRGDVFTHINGVKITSRAQFNEQMSGSSITLTIVNRTEGPEEVTLHRGYYYDHPILKDTIYSPEVLPGPTAYLLYNHFTNGGTNGTPDYADELRKAFKDYQVAGVRNLILDLRYNGGGEVQNAQLLASLIAPRENVARGDVLMYTEEKNSFGNPDAFRPHKFMTDAAAYNADIENLFIITSRNTASASEMIIHTLEKFYGGRTNLHVIGQRTVGKNVGSVTYENRQYNWDISPITLRVYNTDKVSGYETGIDTDGGIVRLEYVQPQGERYNVLPPHGDFQKEWLLNYVTSLPPFGQPLAPGSPTGSMERMTRSPGWEAVEMVPQHGLSAGHIFVTE